MTHNYKTAKGIELVRQALASALSFGGFPDKSLCQQALVELMQIIHSIEQHDFQMSEACIAPTGDDYNKVFDLLTLPRDAAAIEEARVMIGASAAYACIKTSTSSMDVRLESTGSAAKQLRHEAATIREKALKALCRADIIESAAAMLQRQDDLKYERLDLAEKVT